MPYQAGSLRLTVQAAGDRWSSIRATEKQLLATAITSQLVARAILKALVFMQTLNANSNWPEDMRPCMRKWELMMRWVIEDLPLYKYWSTGRLRLNPPDLSEKEEL